MARHDVPPATASVLAPASLPLLSIRTAMPLIDHVPSPYARGRSVRVSLGGLLFGNLALFASYAAGWVTLGELMWTYWLQSVAVGFFHYRRMMALTRFSTEGLTSNDRPVPETPEGKRSTANFFLMHYGFFHLGYAVFLTVEHLPSSPVVLWLAAPALSFIVGERATFRRHLASDPTWTPNLGTLLFQPYLRVIPMHLGIIAAGAAGAVFLPLKLAADLGMYLVDEHLDARRARQQSAEASQALSGG
jgi:hypothetical protein